MPGLFIDRVTIEVRSGRGGDGCVSFRREKHVPRGGPDGGNGGDGGDVILAVDGDMRTLVDLRYRRAYRAGNGKAGSGARKTGRSGEDVVIPVPPGTTVEDAETGELLADLTDENDRRVILEGGKGGKGNYAFRSSVKRAPRRATGGQPGREAVLRLTMKLIADVGIVGLPNAGKSTLLRAVSRAHPEVAPYPFTTLTPTLGIVSVDESASFCMVDIPGLIEGAHQGKGLGVQFLQHIERCRVLLLLIDISSEEDVKGSYEKLLKELQLYSPGLLDKPRIVALNKTDLIEARGPEKEYSDVFSEEVFTISAATGKGVKSLIKRLYSLIGPSQGSLDP